MNSGAWMLTHAKKPKLGPFNSHCKDIQHLFPRKTKFQYSLVALHHLLPHSWSTRDRLNNIRSSFPFYIASSLPYSLNPDGTLQKVITNCSYKLKVPYAKIWLVDSIHVNTHTHNSLLQATTIIKG